MISIIRSFKAKLTQGSERSVKVKLNVAWMMLIKGANILVSLLLLPLTLKYVDSETYGVWLALSSMVGWISFFDIGINNGLRNRLTEAFANADMVTAKQYISTTYAILSIIFIPLMVILLLVLPLLDWNSLLNINTTSNVTLVISACIITAYFCLNFILSTINIVLTADLKPAEASFRTLLQQIVSLLFIYQLTLFTEGSLILLCIGLCVSQLLVTALYNFTLFTSKYKEISPSFKSVRFDLAPSLFKTGLQFFVIQIAFIVQFQISNFLIIRYYGASEVTSYNIAQKYFNISFMVWTIMITPLWAASADAIAKNDIEWIKNVLLKYSKIFFLFCIGMIIQLLLCNWFYSIWVGDDIEVSWFTSFWIMIYNIAMMFGNTLVQILNGLGIIKVQSIASIFSPIVFVASFFIMYVLGMGVSSVIIAGVLANFNGLLIAPVQFTKYISKHKNEVI